MDVERPIPPGMNGGMVGNIVDGVGPPIVRSHRDICGSEEGGIRQI